MQLRRSVVVTALNVAVLMTAYTTAQQHPAGHAGHDMPTAPATGPKKQSEQPGQAKPRQAQPKQSVPESHADHGMPAPPARPAQQQTPGSAQQPSGHAGHQMPDSPPAPAREQSPPGPQQPSGHAGHEIPAPVGQQSEQSPGRLEQGADQIDLPPPPALGRAQERTKGPGLTLEALQEIAVKNNPTLTQAEAEIRAAQGRALQVGLYPNPVLGYTGDEIRGGAFRGGIHGAFIQQTIVLGGKLGLSRRVAEQEVRLAEIERDEQRLRVTNAVRLAYYQVLATQERLETEKAFVQLSADAVETSYQFRRVGQFDQTEALQAEIELEAAEVAVIEQENELRQRWMQLAAVVGDPNLPFATLRGRLDENLPELSREQVIEAFMASPAVRIARAFEVRAEATIARERREPVPDLQIRAATHYNRELREPVVGSTGVDSALEIGIQIPLFNRNQGAVQAARADLERAQQETRRVQLRLRAGASTVLQQYESTRAAVERYRERMIPRAQRAYGAMVQRWGQMAASYPQLLMSQRTLFALQRNYITALENLWTTSIGLQGLLLTDGLEAPARPGEVDLPMSGISVPNSMETRQMESLR